MQFAANSRYCARGGGPENVGLGVAAGLVEAGVGVAAGLVEVEVGLGAGVAVAAGVAAGFVVEDAAGSAHARSPAARPAGDVAAAGGLTATTRPAARRAVAAARPRRRPRRAMARNPGTPGRPASAPPRRRFWSTMKVLSNDCCSDGWYSDDCYSDG
ncbi:hypothetical protein [Streptosporangium sp. NPDC002721]|uniref:hypothetical protein n=1 Tax=Streptosporangium sp. NPDC002721 TaxID=3366188 RepID=UPI00369A5E9C